MDIDPLIPETSHSSNDPTLVSITFYKRLTGKRSHSLTGGCQKPLLIPRGTIARKMMEVIEELSPKSKEAKVVLNIS